MSRLIGHARNPAAMRPPTLLLILLSLLSLLTPGVARADEGRILHRFDFEERDDGNYESTPMHWARVVGPGLPHWCLGRLSADAAHAGRYSFRLDLNGGSVLYRLAPGVLEVRPDAHYRVGGFVRTTPLTYAKARLTAWFVDENGLMIPGSVRHSAAHADDGTGAWAPLNVDLTPDSPAARGIVLEVGLLQPAQLGPDAQTRRDGQRELTTDLTRFRQDVRGSAWFDDVTVSRVPAVRLARGPAGNVFPRGRPVTFTAVVDDSPLGDLSAEARVVDADGRVRAEVRGAFRGGGGGDTDGRALIDFALPRLPAGWYAASFTVAGAGMTAADGSAGATVRRVSFAVLADDAPPGPADARVTVDATNLSAGEWADLPALLPTLAAGRVKLAVWSRDSDLSPAGSLALDALMADLDPLGIRPTAVFAEPPRELAELAGGAGGWAALEPLLPRDSDAPPGDPAATATAAERWHASLSYLVSRHAQQIDRWQIGRDGDAELFAREPRMRRVYAAFDGAIRKLVARADVAMPWPARAGLLAAGDALPRSLTLRVPADVTPAQIPLYVDDVLRQDPSAAHDLSLSLEPLDSAIYGRTEAVSDLAKRLTLCLASGVGRVTVPMPFDAIPEPAGSEPGADRLSPEQPRESYLVLRTMLRGLAGCAYQGRVSAGPGVEAFLFAPPRQGGRGRGARGVLVLWSDRADAASPAAATTLQMNLGDAATQVDLWGNATPLTQSDDDRVSGRASLRVGAVPTLVVGVDAELTRLRASVRLDRTTLESSFEPHALRLSFANPFPTALSGRVELRGPDGWEVGFGAGGNRFSLAPGAVFDRLFEVRFPYNSYAGEKTLEAVLTVRDAADGRERTIRVPLTVRLGLADTSLRTSAWTEGRDVVVEQTIRNEGDATAAWTAFVLFPDRPRQERLVVDLGPGQSLVRTYRFPDAAAALRPGEPTEIRSGLRELEGMRILNDKVELQ